MVTLSNNGKLNVILLLFYIYTRVSDLNIILQNNLKKYIYEYRN